MPAYSTSEAVGEREQLADIISRIDPAETPVYSNGQKETGKGIFLEWQVQELAAATSSNHQNEGYTPTYATPTATIRYGNYMMISAKDARVTGTLDAVDKAGRAKETAYQKTLKGLELRRDCEKYLMGDAVRSANEPRKAGAFSSWITNASVDTTGTSTTLTNVGSGTASPSYSGDTRAMDITFFDAAMQAAWDDGGQPRIAVMNGTNKRAFDRLSSATVAANQYNMSAVKEGVYIGSVGVYLSAFGRLDVTLDRYVGNERVLLLDPDFYSIATLAGRNMVVEDLAKTGDAVNFMIIHEWTLKVKAPKAHAAIYDLSGS